MDLFIIVERSYKLRKARFTITRPDSYREHGSTIQQFNNKHMTTRAQDEGHRVIWTLVRIVSRCPGVNE